MYACSGVARWPSCRKARQTSKRQFVILNFSQSDPLQKLASKLRFKLKPTMTDCMQLDLTVKQWLSLWWIKDSYFNVLLTFSLSIRNQSRLFREFFDAKIVWWTICNWLERVAPGYQPIADRPPCIFASENLCRLNVKKLVRKRFDNERVNC